MAQGTLANLAKSAFVRTPPPLAARIIRNLLSFPADGCTILDPTAGEGDLLFPTWEIAGARRFGIEISAERASVARRTLAETATQILTASFESVTIPPASMSLVLANPPYFFVNGKRAEYRIVADAGEALLPGGILVAILPARSAWDGTMINHWCKWYEQITVWKFPDRTTATDEGVFEDFTQICVVGVRRATPVPLSAQLKKQLQGYAWRSSGSAGQRGWVGGTPPPELPIIPLEHPYQVPPTRNRPVLVVRNADEATLLLALEQCGVQTSREWASATTWTADRQTEAPAMPYTGPAHIASELLTDVLGGQIVTGPGSDGAIAPHLFTAFVESEWVQMPIDREEREKLQQRGVVSVSMRQLQDKPMLGILNLSTGAWQYMQGEDVFTFLQPWLHTLAAQVITRRQPLYQLDPADWELRVLSQFGVDKQLPGAAFPGLAPAQIHRVCAMARALHERGRTAIQGEPGTGKVRRTAA